MFPSIFKKVTAEQIMDRIRFLKYSIYSQVVVVHLNEQKLSSF